MCVVNKRTYRGPGVYIGRGAGGKVNPDPWAYGGLGNPFVPKDGSDAERKRVIAEFKEYAVRRIATDAKFAARVRSLRGQTLICWCAPLACHGDILRELADAADD